MENIKQILIDSAQDMPIEEREIITNAVDAIFSPVDIGFNPTIEDVQRIEFGCNGDFENEFLN